MYFKRIDMHGFKSFAEPVSIDFHEGITCIVGPNGSGKSNISDAIRWVLGEQSPKMLRGGKMEEVIFSGTASRKSRGMAEVTLVVDNSKGILPIDFSEVAITRRMYRSGESEYYINNSSCRLKDIRELIMDTGIGVDGYSIIGQGKISDIVGNKPESRREIFEEAAGIVKYRSKKSEAERKLESTNHNLERVNDIASEIESRIDQLREDSEKATEYVGLRDRFKAIEINITLKNIESLELKNEYMKDDILELENQVEHFRDQKNSIDEDINGNRARSEELDRLGIETRDSLLAKVEEIGNLVNQGQLNIEKKASIDRDTARLEEEIAALDAKTQKEEETSRSLKADKAEVEAGIAHLGDLLADRTKTYEDSLAEMASHASEIEHRKNRIYELQTFAMGKRSEKASLATLRDTLIRRRQHIDEEKTAAAIVESDAEAGKYAANEKKKEILASIADLEREKTDKSSYFDSIADKEATAVRMLEKAKLRSGELSARKKLIEELESTYEGYNNAVKFVMKNLSAMAGVHGVVADLIEVPRGFEVAIETALGAGLQNVVCDDDESAKKAIEKLKVNKAGRLTFLPVKSIRPSRSDLGSGLSEAEGFKGIGVSCIGFDAKYKNIMEYMLGRVVIVDNLENAIKLSKRFGNGLRFVTLEGEVINSSGAITGGNYKSSGPNLLERKSEIRRLEQELSESAAELQKQAEELSRLQSDRRDMAAALGRLDSLKREGEMALLGIENEIKGFEAQLADLAGSKAKWQREIESIESEMTSSGSMIDELDKEAAEAESESRALEQQADAGAQTQNDKKNRVEELSRIITETKIALNASESERNRIVSLEERISTYLADLASDRKSKISQLKALANARTEIDDSDEQLGIVIREKEDIREELESNLRDIQREKDLITGYLKEITAKRESLEENLTGLQSEKYELDLKLARNEAQVEGYKEKLWEEFEISYLQAIDFKHHEFNMAAAQRESREIRNRMKELGEVNIGAIKEYETVSERYEFLTTQRRDLLEAIASLRKIIDDMDRTIKANFRESFEKISANFEAAFVELFGGGSAELRLEDENKPLECGIEIVAQPPGKKLQNINLLSGGEKTMTAIALMFAVLRAKPTPFCILDEVEAALDDANINRFAEYLKNFSEIQFALVTHQKATMEYADVLYGVTMPEQGISKVLSLRLGSAADDIIGRRQE